MITNNPRPLVAVVTGASSGIGKETSKALASQGWRVIAIGRDQARCAAAMEEIGKEARGPAPEMIIADLALMGEVHRVASEVDELTGEIDVLINNAGGIAAQRKLTAEGLEENFASNHLGHFMLTGRLLRQLRSAAAKAPAGQTRIINTSSSAHLQSSGFNWDDLQLVDNWAAGPAYCNAKLANVVFARTLAKRLMSDGIVAHSMHPGTVSTNFASHGNAHTQAYLKSLAHITISPQEGADTLIWLATATEPGQSSGRYFHERTEVPCNPVALNDDVGERLWHESDALIRSVAG